MPLEIEKDGQKIQVFTQDEVNEQVTAKEEELETERSTAEETAADLQRQLDEVNEQLTKEKGKDKNFKNLRDTKESLEKQLGEMKVQIETLVTDIKTNKENKASALKTSYLKARGIDGDKNFTDRFNLHFTKVGKDAKTDEEIQKAVEEAFILAAADNGSPDLVRQTIVTRENFITKKKNATDEETPDSKEMRRDMKLSDEDVKKYGPTNQSKMS